MLRFGEELDLLADELLSNDLKSNQLKVTTRGHVATTLKTPADCSNEVTYYETFGQPAEYADEAKATKKSRWRD